MGQGIIMSADDKEGRAWPYQGLIWEIWAKPGGPEKQAGTLLREKELCSKGGYRCLGKLQFRTLLVYKW